MSWEEFWIAYREYGWYAPVNFVLFCGGTVAWILIESKMSREGYNLYSFRDIIRFIRRNKNNKK